MATLAPLIGHWHTTGTVHGPAGELTAEISGVHLPAAGTGIQPADDLVGQHVVVPDDDVDLRGRSTTRRAAFDSPGFTTLLPQADGRLLLTADGVRSWFDVHAGEGLKRTRWEREAAPGNRELWMDMRFERAG